MVQANGVLYGTAAFGGPEGYGSAFSITGSTVRVIYGFTSASGGEIPMGLTWARGKLYGVTSLGSLGDTCAFPGCGIAFSLTTDGIETTLHSFAETDGTRPMSLTNIGGTLYGVTNAGGTGPCRVTGIKPTGCGTVFRMTPDGNVKVIHNFKGSDGAYPSGQLLDVGGTLFGTTDAGGTAHCRERLGCGTIFSLTP